MMRRLSSAMMVLMISSAFAAAHAAEANRDTNPDANVGDPGWRRTASRYNVTFDEQGRSTIVFEFEIQAVNDRGADAIAHQAFAYHSYLNDVTSVDLATVKADGRVIALDERAIRDLPASTDSSSPSRDDERRVIITYPNVAAGDKIMGRLIYKAKRADFAGEFADDGGAFAERRDRADAGMALVGLK